MELAFLHECIKFSVRSSEICIKAQKDGVSVALELEYVDGEVSEELLPRVWGGHSSAAEFAVLLHEDGARGSCSQRVATGTVCCEDCHGATSLEAKNLCDPAAKIVFFELNHSAVVSAVNKLSDTSLLFVTFERDVGIERAAGCNLSVVGPQRIEGGAEIISL